MSPSSSLRLDKWYCDWIAPGGDAAIAYWASLRWRGLSLVWEQVTDYAASGAERSRWSLTQDPPPLEQGDRILWRAPALGLTYDARRSASPVRETLFESDAGAVEWRVVAPAARVVFARDGATPREGLGYVECLTLEVPPWALPIRELRWGRWIGADGASSLVWIEWRGGAPRTWVFHDGRRVEDAEVTDEQVRAGDVSLALADNRTLHERSFGTIAARIPGLDRVVPQSWLAVRQHTRLSLGTLRLPGVEEPLWGDAIHELVVFP